MAAKKNAGNSSSGSPFEGEPEYLVIGSLRRPHGIHGEIVMELYTDFPERIKPETDVFVGDTLIRLTIAGARFHNEGLIIKFKDINNPEEAGRYRNQSVYVRTADRPALPKGQYYHHELIGFTVINEDKRILGTLAEIMQTGANDVYVVKRPGAGDLLIPVISSVILAVEIGDRQIRVRLLPGLLDE